MNGFKNRLAPAIAAVSLIAMILAPAALAAGSSVKGYGGAGGEVQSSIVSGPGGSGPGDAGPGGAAGAAAGPQSATPPGSATATSPGSLPFTGLDLVLTVVGGMVLLAAGILVAHLAPRGYGTQRSMP